MTNLTRKLFFKHRFVISAALILLFWYSALFPGVTGADGAGLLRLIKNGGSTDWFTSAYFWFLKITSFNGRTIIVTSIFSLLILAFSFYWLVKQLPAPKVLLNRCFLLFLVVPILPVFGLTIGHDNLQVSGIFVLLGIEIRNYYKIGLSRFQFWVSYLSSGLLLITTHTGPIIFIAGLILMFLRAQYLKALILFLIIFGIYFASSIGIEKSVFNGVGTIKTNQAKYYSFIADMKCVAQHEEADISEKDWKFLESLSPKKSWELKMSCRDISPVLNSLNLKNSSFAFDSKEFIKAYLELTLKNPAVVAMAHIQRARGILPPPFFQSPDNQVILDTTVPIGEGTNTALQTGPEVLHPSNDEPSVAVHIKFLKIFNYIAQAGIFLINQASWFWGWAGLWFWVILIYWLWKLKIRKLITLFTSLYPIIVLHIVLFVAIPFSQPRYYMGSIIIGVYLAILMAAELLSKKPTK